MSITKKQVFTLEEKVLASSVYEISWEVCNKVGGIYSVISSKTEMLKGYYKEYVLIGPYIKEKAEQDFIEEDPQGKYEDAIEWLESQGVKAHYGTWLIKGEPKAILIEFDGLKERISSIKKEFWDTHGVDSLFSSWDFEEPMLFSYAAALLMLALEERKAFKPEKTVFQAHEWMTGFAILKLRNEGSKIRTVFTTHATILGRSIAGSNQFLYGMLGKFNPYEKARELNVIDKYTAERAAAQASHVFTTVSEITGKESEYILGRKPDVLLLNGLDLEHYPSIEETSIKHVTSRNTIREFLAYTFFPYYQFDLKHNLSFYLAARYEFENKGIDTFIEALRRINEDLKKMDAKRTISAFIFIAMPNNGAKVELLENKNYYRHIKSYVESKSNEILSKIVNDFLSHEDRNNDILTKEFVQEMRKDVLRFKRQGKPVLCTHKLHEYEEDNKIIRAFKEAGLENSEEDKVKVILYPAFLDGNDSLLNMDFNDVVAGCHLGVFPSYYEPWGYTPLESAALGVPAITTNLAGFGRFIKRKTEHLGEEKGIFVVEREKHTKQEFTEHLYKVMLRFALMDHAERVEHKIRAKELSQLADWKHLAINYIDAHNEAMKDS